MTNELSLETLTPTQVQLTTIVESAKDAIVKFNPDDTVAMDLFRGRCKELQKARLTIKETHKAARDEANAFAKKVIEREKELLGIITPIEDEMKGMLEDLKMQEIRAERMLEMPERKKMIEEVDKDYTYNEQDILEMDHDQFMTYLNTIKAEAFEKMKQAQLAIEAEAKRQAEIKEAEERASQKAKEEAEKKAEEEKLEAQRQADEKIRIAEQAKKDAEDALKRKEEEDLARQKRDEEERLTAIKKEEDDKREAIRKAEEEAQKARDEEETRKKKEAENKAYQEWLQGHGYDDSKFMISRRVNVVTLYKLIDTFNFEDATDSMQ